MPDYFSVLVIGVSVIVVAIFGCAMGQAKVVSSCVEAIARQPAVAGKVQLAMIMGLAFIESLTIYSLMLSFILIGKLPKTDAILEMFKTTKGSELLSSAGNLLQYIAN